MGAQETTVKSSKNWVRSPFAESYIDKAHMYKLDSNSSWEPPVFYLEII